MMLYYVLISLIIGALFASICEATIEKNALGKLLTILLSLVGGFGYFILCSAVYNSYTISLWLGCFVFFAPIVLVAVVWAINYIFK